MSLSSNGQSGLSVGQVLSFDGLSGSYGQTTPLAAKTLTTNWFTISAWIKQEAGNSGFVLAKSSGTGKTIFYGILSDGLNDRLQFLFRAEGSSVGYSTVTVSQLSLDDNKWHHLALYLYGLDMAVYVDGVFKASRSLPRLLEDSDSAAFPLYIGAAVQRTEHFKG